MRGAGAEGAPLASPTAYAASLCSTTVVDSKLRGCELVGLKVVDFFVARQGRAAYVASIKTSPAPGRLSATASHAARIATVNAIQPKIAARTPKGSAGSRPPFGATGP